MHHLHIERHGEGPLLVFTHGGGDTMATWAHQIGHFAGAGWSTLGWDLRGHGRSAAPHDPAYYSRDLAIEDLEALIDGRPAVFVGHSLGGYLSLCVALRHPEWVRALVLVATGPGFRDDVARQRWNRATAKGMAKLPVPDEAAGLLFHTDSWVIDNLGAIAVPVLQIVGARDEMFLRSTNYMATKLTGPTITHVVPGAGHHVHRGAADITNRAIEAFLQGLPPSN